MQIVLLISRPALQRLINMDAIDIIQLCCILCTILTSLPAPLPQESLDFDEDDDILLCCFAILQFLMSIPLPTILQDLNPSFPQSLLPQSRNSHAFLGRDVFRDFSRHEYLFWLLCGETPDTFNDLVNRVRQGILVASRGGQARMREGRPYTLDASNRVLLVLIWLRKYPTLDFLACIFDISIPTVSGTIYHIAPHQFCGIISVLAYRGRP